MKSLDRVIAAFRRFPGVGPKQAERFAMHLLRSSEPETEDFMQAVRALKASVSQCTVCCDYSDTPVCPVCSDPNRDASLICVVQQPQDAAAIEKSGAFKGLYHVLHGAISPMEGFGAGSIRLKELLDRLESSKGGVRELILAMDPDTEGEATAIYISGLAKEFVPKITRIAYGVPLGGDLDYMDEVTLGHALKGRTKI
ncbi:MAG: recombination mediator RecR [Elusimicrobiales bacterium]|nr:recombination mediator RecR [Elusimicrobiales bacterium]